MADQPAAFLPVFEDPADTDTFRLRVERYGPDLLDGLRRVYGERATELHERVLGIMGAGFAARPHDLRLLDEARLLHPDWLQEPGMVGYVAYADRFAGTLA
ncbi:MAG: alpha-amylase, partial [Actinobacteria bacterium]|nr:alpha-amylase [Actinomycetota bacterium]